MKTPSYFKVLYFGIIAILTGISCDAYATKYTISFAYTYYTPNTLTVAIGDTVEWQGDFSIHPLVWDVIPAGAKPDMEGSLATSLFYVVKVGGTYSYYCTAHGGPGGQGMSGSFSTGESDVKASHQAKTDLFHIMPNPATRMTMIGFSLAQACTTVITISSSDGKIIAVPVNTYLPEGNQMVDFDASRLASGVYSVTLEANGVKISKQLVVTK
jgi:plastocyanin